MLLATILRQRKMTQNLLVLTKTRNFASFLQTNTDEDQKREKGGNGMQKTEEKNAKMELKGAKNTLIDL